MRTDPVWARLEAGLLAHIILVAVLLRFYQLDVVPPGPQHDEVFDTLFALSIVKGERPVFFEGNGGVPPLFMYLLAPAMALWGRTLLTARAVAALCGMLSILAGYLLARELWGRLAALLTAAGLTISFWHIFASRVALEPITLALFATLCFYLLWLGLKGGRLIFFALAGAALGLSQYTYHAAPLIPLTLAIYVLYLLLWHRHLFRRRFLGLVTCALIALVLVTPLIAYVLGRPEASTARVRDLSGPLQAAQAGDWQPLLSNAAAVPGMFGWQGDPEWRYNLAGRPVFDPLGALLFYGGFLYVAAKWRRPEYAFLLVWLPVSLLFSAITPPSPSTLRAIGGIAAVYILPAVSIQALWEWTARQGRQTWCAALGSLIALWLVYAGAITARDYFLVWANHPEVRAVYRADLAEAARYLDAHDVGGIIAISAPYAADLDRQAFEMVARRPHRLKWFDGRRGLVLPAPKPGEKVSLVLPSIGLLPQEIHARFLGDRQPAFRGYDPQGRSAFSVYELDQEALAALRSLPMKQPLRLNWNDVVELLGYDLAPTAVSGGYVPLTLYWRVLSQAHPPDSAAPIFASHLIDARENLWGQDNYLAFYPSQWSHGDIVISWFHLSVPVDAPPGEYRAAVSLLAGDKTLPVRDAMGQPLPHRVALGSVMVARGEPPTGPIDLRIHFPRQHRFGPVKMLGVDGAESTRPGETWRLAIYWQAIDKPPEDYTVVLRFHGNNDEQVMEWREVLLKDVYPTSRWRPGEYLRSHIYVPIPADRPYSKGRVRVNLYDAAGQPLSQEPGISVIGLAIGSPGR